MPNNCSTLIQRKNILHKVLRSNSEGKLQNAITETTAEIRVGGVRKPTTTTATNAPYSSSTSRLTPSANAGPTVRRANLFTSNRVQPTSESFNEKHLPSIRDVSAQIERQYQQVTHERPKTPVRIPSASPSSVMNALAKRSTENFASTNGDVEDTLFSSPMPPPSRRSRRPNNGQSKPSGLIFTTTPKHILTPTKQSGDSGVDIHYSPSSPEQNYRPGNISARQRTQQTYDNPSMNEPVAKERTSQLYQRRPNHTFKAPIRQKIDKYRRRSEEAVNAANSTTNLVQTANIGLTATAPTLATPPSHRVRHAPSSPKAVRRVTSDAEVRARLEVLRLSIDTNLARTEENHRIKSPYLYTTHQQLAPVPPPTAQTTSTAVIRPSHGPAARLSSGITPTAAATVNHRRQTNAQTTTTKSSMNNAQTNLYLAFIASRHLSTLEGTLVDCDIDHPKLLRIFTWLKNVEEHRHEIQDHDQLLVEQNQKMLDQEENLSLYSEIQHAVDDLPPNTAGVSHQIPTMNFEN